MDNLYEKIAFVWDEPRPLVEAPERLSFRPVSEVGLSTLTQILSRVMAKSLDRNDQKAVAEPGASEAAARFVASARKHFDYEEAWWQLGFLSNGEVAGFVQPVIYRGCRRGDLDEATIFHMGVVPEQRGRGYGYDLLCRATRVLQEVRVWRVFCDTDVRNAPMIRVFEAVGYARTGGPQTRPFWDFK
jgi:RimJ/RimL family protein N-acetyltransferase